MTVQTTIDQSWSLGLFLLALPDELAENPWLALTIGLILLWVLMILFFRGRDRGRDWYGVY